MVPEEIVAVLDGSDVNFVVVEVSAPSVVVVVEVIPVRYVDMVVVEVKLDVVVADDVGSIVLVEVLLASVLVKPPNCCRGRCCRCRSF